MFDRNTAKRQTATFRTETDYFKHMALGRQITQVAFYDAKRFPNLHYVCTIMLVAVWMGKISVTDRIL